jgi:hypothetical protein
MDDSQPGKWAFNVQIQGDPGIRDIGAKGAGTIVTYLIPYYLTIKL